MAEYTVALTGGIGSGKSTVSALFARLGVSVIDADEISHTLTAPDGEALPEIAATFGAHLIDAEGCLDRPALRRLVFEDPQARRRLEGILHPRIRALMIRQAADAAGPYVLLSIPLLFEVGQESIADRVLVVDLPPRRQIERVRARSGLEESEIRRILASQVTRTERLRRADDVIDNGGTPDDLAPQVERLHRRYLRLAGERTHRDG